MSPILEPDTGASGSQNSKPQTVKSVVFDARNPLVFMSPGLPALHKQVHYSSFASVFSSRTQPADYYQNTHNKAGRS